jgi:hypothetical protein
LDLLACFFGVQQLPHHLRSRSNPTRLDWHKESTSFTVAACGDCHSQRHYTRFGGPVIEGGDGLGFAFPKEMVVAPNITPDKETGIGNWTDGEVIRAIREGVSRDGQALFPLMPYAAFT